MYVDTWRNQKPAWKKPSYINSLQYTCRWFLPWLFLGKQLDSSPHILKASSFCQKFWLMYILYLIVCSCSWLQLVTTKKQSMYTVCIFLHWILWANIPWVLPSIPTVVVFLSWVSRQLTHTTAHSRCQFQPRHSMLIFLLSVLIMKMNIAPLSVAFHSILSLSCLMKGYKVRWKRNVN